MQCFSAGGSFKEKRGADVVDVVNDNEEERRKMVEAILLLHTVQFFECVCDAEVGPLERRDYALC